jgi:hypothetical protein
LVVVPPSTLPSATPLVLILDREGSLAVYIGRAGCAEPGRNVLISRATSTKDEEGVDVSMVTQVINRILAKRIADGTAIFEGYGDHHRRLVTLEEIVVICIDLSQSMTKRCGFIDVKNNEDIDTQIAQRSTTTPHLPSTTMIETPAFHLPDSNEILKAYESSDDGLAIVHTSREDFERRLNAEKVLQIIQQVDRLQIQAKVKELQKLRRSASHYYHKTLANNIEREIDTVKNRCVRMEKYKSLLCAWLLTCLGDNRVLSDPLAWHPGDFMPKIPKVSVQQASIGPAFQIPREYCCRISSELMDDPVITIDGFMYDWKNVE